jgi:dephospho-CoA kinase
VAAYDTTWPESAARVLLSLDEPFAGLATRADHIGSTAVPGMAAKDVLDLQISVVTDLDATARALDAPLARLGFERSPHRQDHRPAAAQGRSDDWSKQLWVRRQLGRESVNLHVRPAGAPNERLALLFRDWFRVHPSAVAAYSSFKSALAEACPDIDTYTEVKDPVVDLVVAAAEEWASATGWRA